MKTLLVMRHAKSSWDNAHLADHDRPLKNRGKMDAPLMGRFIHDQGLVPELIISSSAVRALATAEAVASASDFEGEIQVTRDLYHADPMTIIDIVRGLPDKYSTVMIVGHNPGMEEFIEEISGRWYRMPTAALAELRLPIDSWSELEEEEEFSLANLWTPRDLTGST